MRTLGKILAGICAVLFVITGVAAMLLFNIEGKVFSADTYKQAFENQKLYDRMPGVLATALSNSIAEDENAASYLKAISKDDWERSISSLLPPEELKALAIGSLDSIFDYLNGKTDSAAISLLPFKRHMVGDSGVNAIKQILRLQPDCTSEQLLQMGLGLITGGDLIFCSPPEDILELMTPVIETQLQFMTLGLPDEVTLIPGKLSDTPNDPRLKLDGARVLLKLTPLVPLVFLFGLTIFAVRSLINWLKWWGWPFMITGVISLFVALLGASTLGFLIQRIIQNRGSGLMPPILFSTFRETISAIAQQILKPVGIEGLILALIGLAMIIFASYIFKKKKTKESPAPAAVDGGIP